VSRDGLTEDLQMPLDGELHRNPVLFPQTGATLDVAEEKRDSAPGQIRHGVLHDATEWDIAGYTLRSAVNRSIQELRMLYGCRDSYTHICSEKWRLHQSSALPILSCRLLTSAMHRAQDDRASEEVERGKYCWT
jgi:hypothetical protein